MWVKWLRRIEVGDSPGTTARKRRNTPTCWQNGTARALHLCDGREVRHHQSEPAGAAQSQAGFTVLSGIAWSGRGKIARVDVSLDGGRNWRTARIDGPAWTRR